MQIQVDDTPQALSVTLGQTLVRLLVGGVGLLHGTEKLLNPHALAAELSQLGVPNPEIITSVLLYLELGAGVLLVLGRFTRTAAFALYCDAMLSVAMLYIERKLALDLNQLNLIQLEALALQSGCCLFFLVVGSGPFGADFALRRRARLRAIANDELWKRPPYVV